MILISNDKLPRVVDQMFTSPVEMHLIEDVS